jgi:predicted RNA polymerase sigma factor
VRPTTRVEDLLRELARQVLGVVARQYRDFEYAEDAVQEALFAAATQWPAGGLPDSPRGWLIAVATRRMTERLRNEEARRRREELAAVREPSEGAPPVQSATTRWCCSSCAAIPRSRPRPRSPDAARRRRPDHRGDRAAFLVPEATMAQRISRAKQRIKASGVPFVMPTGGEWAERLRSVLHVLYLIFTEGTPRPAACASPAASCPRRRSG